MVAAIWTGVPAGIRSSASQDTITTPEAAAAADMQHLLERAHALVDDWRQLVLRCAEKLGRPVRDCQVLTPAADFPSLDGQPPLKTLILQF